MIKIENPRYIEKDFHPILEVELNGITTRFDNERKLALFETGCVYLDPINFPDDTQNVLIYKGERYDCTGICFDKGVVKLVEEFEASLVS